jgi:site-specific DNA-cytosine methylase
MKKRECFSLFSGGGLFPKGAQEAGIDIIGGLEIDSKKADIYKLNFGSQIHVADIREFEQWEPYQGCWMLQASPPCKNSSRAKRHKNETEKEIAFDLDLQLAYGVNRALTAIKPRYFVLENVGDYAATESYKMIRETLSRLGYTFRQFRLNSADFGVPQSRDRLYQIASRDSEVIERLDFTPYYRPRIGWYAGIERHLATCKEKTLAQYQVTAIERSIESGKIAPNDIAVLVGGAGSNPNKPGVTHWASPSPTVRSCEGLRSGGWRPVVVYQKDFYQPFGEVVGYKLNSRCLLALQGVPDEYQTGNDVVTCFVAGNGVSVPVARAIVQTLIAVENSLRTIAGDGGLL